MVSSRTLPSKSIGTGLFLRAATTKLNGSPKSWRDGGRKLSGDRSVGRHDIRKQSKTPFNIEHLFIFLLYSYWELPLVCGLECMMNLPLVGTPYFDSRDRRVVALEINSIVENILLH